MKSNPATQQEATKRILYAALGITDPLRREEYLEQACESNRELRRRVNQLLAAHQRSAVNPLDWVVDQLLPPPSSPADSDTIDIASHPMIGPYRLLEQIGKGGMGTVYMAQQSKPIKRKVALKVITPGMDSQQVIARFEAERQALALMDHPNIARVLDAGTSDAGRLFFVMELVNGLPITEYVETTELSIEERLRILIEICQGVHHAHQKGIIHRDLKPGNVLITLHHGKPFVKIIDFGIAKAVNQELTERTLFTQFNQMVGTPLYMSPEQAALSTAEADTRSDIYSLGVLLYELLTGTTPVERDLVDQVGLDEIRRMIREIDAPRPSQRVSTLCKATVSTLTGNKINNASQFALRLRGELDWIVLRALEKDPNRRYDTARALADDLQRYLDGEAVSACPPSVRYRFQKFTRRNKAILFTTVLVVATLSLGTVVSSWLAWEANQARGLADQRLATANQQKTVAEKATTRWQKLLYAADMKLASDAWVRGDIPRVGQLLNRHRPIADGQDLRGFEWYLLRNAVNVPRLMKIDHDCTIWQISYSPDGSLLAAAGSDGNVYVYGGSDFRRLDVLSTGAKSVNAVAWSPDSKQVAAARSDGVIAIWDWANRTSKLTIEAHQGQVQDAIFSADGRSLITGGEDGKISVWLTADGSALKSWQAHSKTIVQLAISPDGTRVASTSRDQTVSVWNLDDASQLQTWNDPTTRMACLVFSPAGEHLAFGSISGDVILANVADGETQVLARHMDGIESLTFVNQGTHLALAAGDRGGAVHLHPVQEDESNPPDELLALTVSHWAAHSGHVQCMTLSPSGRQLVSAGRDGIIAAWGLYNSTISWSCGHARDLALTSNDELVSLEYGIRMWDLKRGVATRFYPTKLPPWWRRLAASADGRKLVAAADKAVTLFDLEKGRESRWNAADVVAELEFSPDGRHVVMRWHDGLPIVQVFDVSDPSNVHHLDVPDVPGCGALCFSPDGKRLAVSSLDDLLLFEIRIDESPKRLLHIRGHSSSLVDVAFSPDGRRIATVSHDRHLKIWDSETGDEQFSVVAHSDRARSVAYSPDGNTIATGSRNGKVKAWSAESGQPLLELDTGSTSVDKLVFSSDSRQLVCHRNGASTIVYDARDMVQKKPDVPSKSATQIDFFTLGDFPGGEHISGATDVSADGSVVVGISEGTDGIRCFRWTRAEGLMELASPWPVLHAQVSEDGLHVFARSRKANPRQTVRWSAPAFDLELLAESHFINADPSGRTYVGGLDGDKSQPRQAILGTADSIERLPYPERATQSTARAISSSTGYVVGAAWEGANDHGSTTNRNMQVVRWHAGAVEVLPGFDTENNWCPWDISANGEVVVGARWPHGTSAWTWNGRLSVRPFIWKDGAVAVLGPRSGVFNRITPDGRVAVGEDFQGPFVWDERNGIRHVEDMLASYGVFLSGWRLDSCTSISVDGTTIVGECVATDGRREGWVLRVPPDEFSID